MRGIPRRAKRRRKEDRTRAERSQAGLTNMLKKANSCLKMGHSMRFVINLHAVSVALRFITCNWIELTKNYTIMNIISILTQHLILSTPEFFIKKAKNNR